MIHNASPLVFDRRNLLAGLALLGIGAPAAAETGPPLSAEKLDNFVRQALESTQEIKFARPEILGFRNMAIVTRQLTRSAPNQNYYIAVVVPEIDDGIMFFRGTEEPLSFVMHRTGKHLRRLVSARNADGQLSQWTGKPADQDFSSQLTFWSRE
jgi:hypothetical protein